MSSHYFSSEPTAPHQPRALRVTLAGEERLLSTDAGIFSPDAIDKGTAILLAEAPSPAAQGNLLDVGCGWGPIALTLALRSPEATVYAVDVNERALGLTRQNAERLGLSNLQATLPDQLDPAVRFQTIWSNPPIRVGKEALHQILQQWLPRLAPGGSAYLVVQKNLGSDSLQQWLTNTFKPNDFAVRRYATAKSFRILEIRNPGA